MVTCVSKSRLHEFVQKLLWNGVSCFVVLRHALQGLLLPDPVLQHLRRSFHKIPLHMSPAEHRKVSLNKQKNVNI